MDTLLATWLGSGFLEKILPSRSGEDPHDVSGGHYFRGPVIEVGGVV